ncbi:hypothetical protein LOK49_LG01G03209 [Camellia lanceoleosa]|uniref:Uncharacterized protein n=1 Tax=Camellia lanceoleosa TaxID=1840588 RepID=A0ACC0J6I8_9ERIC|nr:hypothetical protein LOK49_LG01G03209 [Camellia lanceoleosa]
MERLLKPYDKEYMKMAMLKHEETFKQQVYELHRLYRIQKILMMKTSTDQNSKQKGQNQEIWDSRSGISLNQMMNNNIHQKPPPELDLEQPAEEYVMECDGDGELEIEDENEIRLTLGPTSYYRRRKKAETPPSSDSGPSFSSSSGTDISREETRGQKWGLTMVPDSNYGFQSARKNSFDVEEEQLSLSQDRLQQAPWLFQSLRLNMT